MAPKKKGASGPTAQEVEDDWKRKENAWMQEEKQLEYFAKLMQDDARHYRMRSRELAVDVEALTSRSQFLESKSADLRIQFKKMSKSIAEQQGTETTVMSQQESTLQEMNDSLQTSRSELLALNAAFEATAGDNAEKVKSVAFRTSGIAALREKVMKLRNERAHLQTELLSLGSATSALQSDCRRAPFMRRPNHCIIVGPPGCASLSMLSRRLRDSYGFDITQYHPTPPARANAAPDGISRQLATDASPSSSSCIAALAFGEPCIGTFIDSVHSGHNTDASTCVMRHLHALLWSAARGAFGDTRRIVLLVGTQQPVAVADETDGSAIAPLDGGVCFPLSVGAEGESDGKDVVVSLRDVLDVLLLRQQPSASHCTPNSLIAIELVSRDFTERHMIVVAETQGADEGGNVRQFLPTVLRYENKRASPLVGTAADHDAPAARCIGGGGSSVVGMQLLKILEEIACSGGVASLEGMSSLELSQRLSMGLLNDFSDESLVVTRVGPPQWLVSLLGGRMHAPDGRSSIRRPQTTAGGTGSTMLLPPPRLAPPVQSTSQQMDVSFFVPDFVRHTTGTPPLTAGDYGPHLNTLCRDALAFASSQCTVDGCALTDRSMALPDPEDRSVLHYCVVGAVSARHFIQELQSAVRHHLRLGYGLELNTEAEKDMVLGKALLPLTVTCVAEAADCFVVKISPVRDPTREHGTPRCEAGGGQNNSNERPCFRKALAMPMSLRGSDRAAFVAHPGAPVAISTIVEEHVVHGFPSGDVRVIGVVEARMTATIASNDVAEFLKVWELAPLASWTSGGFIAPRLTPRHAFLPLARAKFCDALHWKQLQGTTAAQQIVVLIVAAPSDATSAPDHRHPRSLFEDQREEIDAAARMVSEFLPQQLVASCAFFHVSLDDLQCTTSDRDAVMGATDSDAAGIVEKKAVWRNIMSLFSPRVGEFITRVSYPCALVTCPSMSPLEHTHALVIPRSMETRRSQTRADCLFKAATLASAVQYFYRLVLRTTAESSNALRGLASKLDEGEDLDASFDSNVDKPGLFSISEQLPSSWFPV